VPSYRSHSLVWQAGQLITDGLAPSTTETKFCASQPLVLLAPKRSKPPPKAHRHLLRAGKSGFLQDCTHEYTATLASTKYKIRIQETAVRLMGMGTWNARFHDATSIQNRQTGREKQSIGRAIKREKGAPGFNAWPASHQLTRHPSSSCTCRRGSQGEQHQQSHQSQYQQSYLCYLLPLLPEAVTGQSLLWAQLLALVQL